MIRPGKVRKVDDMPKDNDQLCLKLSAAGLILAALLTGIISSTLLANAKEPQAADTPQKTLDDQQARALATNVHAIFESRCADCHGPEATRKGGSFSDILPLTALAKNQSVLEPGSPDDSILWWEIDDGRMPPKGEKPLTAREKLVIKEWIQAGAPTTLLANVEVEIESTTQLNKSDARKDSATRGKSWQAFLGQFHVVVLHFPIALIIASLLAEVIYAVTKATGLAQAGRFCLWLGTLGALAATFTGWAHLTTSNWADNSLANQHALLGYIMAGVAVAALIAGEWRLRQKENRPARMIYWLMLLAAAGLVAYTGHLGGILVHGELWWW